MGLSQAQLQLCEKESTLSFSSKVFCITLKKKVSDAYQVLKLGNDNLQS